MSTTSGSTSRDPISYIIENNSGLAIADANYLSLYGATASADFSNSIEAATDEVNKLSMYNLNNLSKAHEPESMSRTQQNGETGGYDNMYQRVKEEDETSGITAITHQSIDEALYELKFKRKSTAGAGGGNSPIYSAIFNMLAGCGVVGLPVTYKNSGLTTGIVMMVVVAILSVYTLRYDII